MNFDAGSLFLSLIVSSIGFVLFHYGRKQQRIPHLATGVALMVYPYFVGDVLWMLLVAIVLLTLLWMAVRAGH